METVPFSIVVAYDKSMGIGKDGDMPWHLPKDLAHFKSITTDTSSDTHNIVIMGRKTWDSIPEKYRPLPGRTNIVLSRSELTLPNAVHLAHSLDEALSLSRSLKAEKTFVIGGGTLFKEGLAHPNCQAVYVTEINSNYDCDTFFTPYELRFKNKENLGECTDNQTPLRFLRFS